MKSDNSKKAYLLTGILVLLCLFSLLSILLYPRLVQNQYTAYIYVNGDLYETIPLSRVTEEYTLTISASDGGYNTILVQPNAISITSADCPDQICVKQGTITNSLLPITCLPHGVVIELKPEDNANTNMPDIITH